MKIIWTKHAEERQKEWERIQGVTRQEIENLLANPPQIVPRDQGVLVAQMRKGTGVTHRTNQYWNNRIEQDHRGIKQRYYGMRGSKSFGSASRFCTAFDALRNYLRPRQRMQQSVSLAQQRKLYLERFFPIEKQLAGRLKQKSRPA